MEIAPKYNPADVEDKWYKYWMENGFFASKPDGREPYTIVMPPPNVTGVLHMGHMLNNSIQDILVRRARMLGKNACWVPGTDHASIATEAKVVAKLAQEGVKKTDLSRDEFLSHAWDWTHTHGGIILEQLKKLGASCDWERTCFTMDEKRSESVIKVFVDLFDKGLIYRDFRMVNWDPQAKTTLSDEEVIYKEEHSKLYYLKYYLPPTPSQGGGANYIVIATTRPETILGDTAVCVNPNDPRYTHLKGKQVIVPIVNRAVPVIMDEYVDMEFGTGCLKVTPAHDENDYVLGKKHKLAVIDIFNDDASLNDAYIDDAATASDTAKSYVGMDRFAVREKIVKDLEAANLIEKTEDYDNKVGHSERTDVVIEPKLSWQWFLKMQGLAKPALDAVMDDTIKFHPAKFKNTYRYWMENIRDWNISRQLWWGHRIPAYYYERKGFVVGATPDEAVDRARKQFNNPAITVNDLRQDEDCLDTWFSSWLWPISVFDGINDPHNADIEYYYSTNDLVTAPDIIFFWVARMIMAGYEYRATPCFYNVYYTGMVRDKQGRKMSKSLGNSPDPIELMNQYGADGVRMGMLLTAPAGNDIPFDEKLCEQGRNFNNKIWNAFRLVKGWETADTDQPESARIAVEWFYSKLHQAIGLMDESFGKYRISEALMEVYKLFWDEFSSWYLEMIKPAYGQPIDSKTYQSTAYFFDALLKLLHPFMPFITEELWQALQPRQAGESIMVSAMPGQAEHICEKMINEMEEVKEIIANVRTVRLQKNIAGKDSLDMVVLGKYDAAYNAVIMKMANLDSITEVKEKPAGSVSFLVKTTEYAIPLGNNMNKEEELAKLQEELVYLQGFLRSVEKKLSNESFVSKAPAAVIENERKKQADAESKIKTLQDSIAALQ